LHIQTHTILMGICRWIWINWLSAWFFYSACSERESMAITDAGTEAGCPSCRPTNSVKANHSLASSFSDQPTGFWVKGHLTPLCRPLWHQLVY